MTRARAAIAGLLLLCAVAFSIAPTRAGLDGLSGLSGLSSIAGGEVVTLPDPILDFTSAATTTNGGPTFGENVLTIAELSGSGATVVGGSSGNAPVYNIGPKFTTDDISTAHILIAESIPSFSSEAFTFFLALKQTSPGNPGYEYRQVIMTLGGQAFTLGTSSGQISATSGAAHWSSGIPYPVTDTAVSLTTDGDGDVLPFAGALLEAGGQFSFRRQGQNGAGVPSASYTGLVLEGLASGHYPFVGDMRHPRLFGETLTTAQRVIAQAALRTEISEAAPAAPTEQYLFIGDSLTVGFMGEGTFTGYTDQVIAGRIAAGAKVKAWNLGISGRTTTQMLAEASQFAALYSSNIPKNIAVVWGGTNDPGMGSGVTSTTYNNLAALGTALRTAGFYVIVVDCLPRGASAQFETDRQALNAAIASGYSAWADARVAIGSDATIGVAGSQDNTTNYLSDKIHLTSAGYAPLITAVNAAIAAAL